MLWPEKDNKQHGNNKNRTFVSSIGFTQAPACCENRLKIRNLSSSQGFPKKGAPPSKRKGPSATTTHHTPCSLDYTRGEYSYTAFTCTRLLQKHAQGFSSKLRFAHKSTCRPPHVLIMSSNPLVYPRANRSRRILGTFFLFPWRVDKSSQSESS